MSEIKIYHARISNIYTLPYKIGVYVITYTIDKIHAEKYVGSTKNLYGRIYDHLNKNIIKNIIYIDIYITNDIFVARSVEKMLIELTNPSSNIRIPSYLSNDDKKIMNELLKNNKLCDYIFDDIVQIGYRYLNLNTNRNTME